jgi:hypothetical protein
MANLALTRYMRREQRAKFTVWKHVVVPWTATLALLPVLNRSGGTSVVSWDVTNL